MRLADGWMGGWVGAGCRVQWWGRAQTCGRVGGEGSVALAGSLQSLKLDWMILIRATVQNVLSDRQEQRRGM